MISPEGRSLALVTFVTTYPSMTRQSLQARDSTGHIAALTESSILVAVAGALDRHHLAAAEVKATLLREIDAEEKARLSMTCPALPNPAIQPAG